MYAIIFHSDVSSIYADFYTLDDIDKWKLFMEDKLNLHKFAPFSVVYNL